MERVAKRTVCILLVLCMCMAMLPQMAQRANALTPTYTVSSAYKSSSYYSSLLKVELTGNQRDDIINVALSQVGYREGDYSGDYSGADDGSYNNYVEYNYWYHNYINSGMPVGGSYAPWCATFVSWCAEQANIPSSILQRSTAAGHSSWYFNLNFYAGGSTLASSSDNDSYFMGYNYTPKKGDLFFTRSWSHVGLVVSSDGTYVTTVEGNTNNDGSADGFGVFVRTRYVDDLYFGVPEYAEDYVSSSCTYYPAHCQITIDSDTPVNSQPCSVGNNDSETLETAYAGNTYTATGMYKNSFGNFWYRIETGSGETGYIYAGDSTFVEDYDNDIALSSDAAAPNGHVAGSVFVVNGTISSQYSGLTEAAVYIYSGFGTSGTVVTGDSDTVSGKSYVLNNSTIDYNTSFGSLSAGKYTYAVSVDYTNYHATDATTLASTSGTIDLMTEYFMVISASADQSTCSHNYTITTLEAATCTSNGSQVKSCAICGHVVTETAVTGGHSYGGWTTVAATCTADGYKTRTCSVCKHVEKQTIPATGHSYSQVSHSGDCQNYPKIEYICGTCGHNYFAYADNLYSAWSTTKPTGIDESLIQSKQQYRYSDYETLTSNQSSLSGYTQIGSQWIQSGTKTVEYVNSWDSGFSTSNSLYTQYNKKSSKVTASETTTAKTVINSDNIVGYLWFHWCPNSGIYSSQTKTGSYTNFHAFYSTTYTPSNYDNYDASDGSYRLDSSTACSHSTWYWPVAVYAQKSTSYQKEFTYERWTDYSAWSDTEVAASDTRKVETRTVYRYVTAELGTHNWSNGVCSTCGKICTHSTYANGFCTVCAMAEPVKDFYLFGYINGANYGCEEDAGTIGQYKFVNGKLTVTFGEVSYVAVKSGDNTKWYMTNGYPGDDATSATLYSTDITGVNSDKLRVPKGRQITFTLVENSDGSLTLSYTAAGCNHSWSNGSCSICGESCQHSWSNGSCSICGESCQHSWNNGTCGTCGLACTAHSYSNNVCTICGAAKPVKDYYLFGYINGANYACEEDYTNIGIYKFVNGKLTVKFDSNSYVAVKSGDNQDWYMTNGWQGMDVTSATLYNNNSGITAEKLYVPGGVEVTFTLTDNGNDTYILSYTTTAAPVTNPTFQFTGASLAFENEIFYQFYFMPSNTADVVEYGIITFTSKLTNGTHADAVDVLPGAVAQSNGSYMVRTNGIAAKEMGDWLYFRVYAKLTDGSYAYATTYGYRATAYANTVLNGNSDTKTKALMVAMLNYGAAAQEYFGHNTDSLMNAGLTAAQKALVEPYRADMIGAIVSADSSKTAAFPKDTTCYTPSISVSFEGAFAVNYYFTPKHTPDGELTMYYWDTATYNSISAMTRANATGVITLEKQANGSYLGAVEGIAAKDVDSTIYVALIYRSNGVEYCSGILAYSLGTYCKSVAGGNSAMQPFGAATSVYSYYAKQYFAD